MKRSFVKLSGFVKAMTEMVTECPGMTKVAIYRQSPVKTPDIK